MCSSIAVIFCRHRLRVSRHRRHYVMRHHLPTSVNCCFHLNSCCEMKKTNGCSGMKNGFLSFWTMNCYDKLHVRKHRFYAGKKFRYRYWSPYCVYCSDGCMPNLCSG